VRSTKGVLGVKRVNLSGRHCLRQNGALALTAWGRAMPGHSRLGPRPAARESLVSTSRVVALPEARSAWRIWRARRSSRSHGRTSLTLSDISLKSSRSTICRRVSPILRRHLLAGVVGLRRSWHRSAQPQVRAHGGEGHRLPWPSRGAACRV